MDPNPSPSPNSQVELHPFNQQAQLLRYAKEQGIAVTGFRSGLGLEVAGLGVGIG